MRLDTMRTIQTPEGVVLTLRVAGPVVRGLAWSIDVLIRSTLYSAVGVPMAFLGETGMGLLMIAIFLLEWFYPVGFELLNRGATPGKAALGITVVRDDGTPLTFTSSVLRNLLRAADFLPFAYLGGFLSMVFSRDFRRLGDLAAGTVVIYRDRVRTPDRLPQVPALAPPVPLDPEERRAIIEFAERSGAWTQERAEEIATIATPLTESSAPDSVARLHGMARWLLGAA